MVGGGLVAGGLCRRDGPAPDGAMRSKDTVIEVTKEEFENVALGSTRTIEIGRWTRSRSAALC
jgi:hypothetical protein